MHCDREARNRYVAFAFATADVLLEVDGDDRIAFAAGTLARFGASGARGRGLFDLFAPADRGMIAFLAGELHGGGRRGPVRVHSADGLKTAQLCLLRTQPQGPLFATLGGLASRASDAQGDIGLADKERFIGAVERELSRQLASEDGLVLSVVKLGGLDAAPGGADGPVVADLLAAIGDALRAVASHGALAGSLGDGKFAAVHRAGEDEARLSSGLERVLSESPAGSAVTLEHRPLAFDEADLSPHEAGSAVRFVLDHLARTGCVVSSLTDALRARLTDTAARVQAAKSVIEERRFAVLYQPIVRLADGDSHHSEALTRLGSEEPIFDFVTFAESIGFVMDFDLAVAAVVLEKLRTMARRGKRPHVAVNVSARSLQCDRFVDALLRLCQENRDTARQLMFEVTESFQLTDLVQADAVLQSLRRAGHEVCLDDFGAGAAAFHYIRALNVDYVKLDGGFVQRLADGARDTAVLRSMVELCRSLKVETIAEMVESEQQVTMLRSFGVTFAQGYLFGRPAAEPVVSSAAHVSLRRARRQGVTQTWAR
ncbi:MAG: EAL domain-containing protein [Geminicoccaceae bacterium]|nr:MAG: EAL domain-containing protein [Geminicoccaceae bacterium]